MVNCGHVYCLYLPAALKEKLVVPAFIEGDRVRFFVINTDPTEYQLLRPEVAKHVLLLPKVGHEKFLTRDSWLACHEVVGGWKVAEIETAKDCYRGPLNKAAVATVKAVIKESRLYSEPEKEAIFKEWP